MMLTVPKKLTENAMRAISTILDSRHLGVHGRTPWALWTAGLLVAVPASLFGLLMRFTNGFGGRIRFLKLTAKGNLTKFAPPIELWLRSLTVSGHRHLVKVVINPGLTPNAALRDLYATTQPHLLIIDQATQSIPWVFWLVVERVQQRPSAYRQTYALRALTVLWLEPPRLPTIQTLRATTDSANDRRRIIAISSRQSAYYRLRATRPTPQRASLLNDVNSPNNVPIDQFIPVAKDLAAQGFRVLRMGQAFDDPTPECMTAMQPWDPEVDLEIFTSAALHICGATGTWSLSAIFNRVVLLTDSYAYQTKTDLTPFMWIMYRRLYDTHLKRPLSIEETLQIYPHGRFVEFADSNSRYLAVWNKPDAITRAANFILKLDPTQPHNWPWPSASERRTLEMLTGNSYQHGRGPRLILDDGWASAGGGAAGSPGSTGGDQPRTASTPSTSTASPNR
jgi:hypothetical protein